MNDLCRIRFLPSGREVAAPAGTWLTTAATRAGVAIVHDCDGQGVCSTCRVQVVEGGGTFPPPDSREIRQLGGAIDDGWRLCCLLVVREDCAVRVPTGDFAYAPALQPED